MCRLRDQPHSGRIEITSTLYIEIRFFIKTRRPNLCNSMLLVAQRMFQIDDALQELRPCGRHQLQIFHGNGVSPTISPSRIACVHSRIGRPHFHLESKLQSYCKYKGLGPWTHAAMNRIFFHIANLSPNLAVHRTN